MKQPQVCRIIALDVRAQRFGFAVVETPARLVDSGVRGAVTHRRAGCIADLLCTYQPSTVVLRRITVGGKRDFPGARNVTRVIQNEARRFGIPTALVGESKLKKFFHEYGKHGKDQIASLLAASFPELKWKLPPPRKRKSWKSEVRRMSVFDAVEVGIVFLATHVNAEDIRAALVSG